MESNVTVASDVKITPSNTNWFKGCKKDENHCSCCKLAAKAKKQKCEFCQKSFDSIPQMKLHMHQSHDQPSDVDFIQCDKCTFQTVSKNGLAKHLKSHDDNLKMKKCFYCEFKSKDDTTRSTQMNEAHKWLYCNVCDI